jgi:hypothetical protein
VWSRWLTTWAVAWPVVEVTQYYFLSLTYEQTDISLWNIHPVFIAIAYAPRWVSWLKVSYLDFINLPNPFSCTLALGSTQPLAEMSTRNLPGGG